MSFFEASLLEVVKLIVKTPSSTRASMLALSDTTRIEYEN